MKALSGMPREELEDVVIKQETLELHCEYCRKRYLATPAMVQGLLDRMGAVPDPGPDADEGDDGDEGEAGPGGNAGESGS
jgi:hypothetical protein